MPNAERVIPLTPSGVLWSQREYVACMALGIGFAAHRYGDLKQAFHYAFPEGIGCTTVIVGTEIERYIDHPFSRSSHDWIMCCQNAIAGVVL